MVLVVLPSFPLNLAPLFRTVRMIDARFSNATKITFISSPDDIVRYREVFLDREIRSYSEDGSSNMPTDILVTIKGSDGTLPAHASILKAESLYCVETDGRLKLLNKFLDKKEDPGFAKHVFNAFTPPHSEGLFSIFPYSYLFRYPGIGEYNEFGHRIRIDHRSLIHRPPEHKVIACFGGSACWSIYCYDNEVFTHRLEEVLNDRCRISDHGTHFTVLNFGLPGNVVLNEIITYLLHCQDIRPDIVVAHDGFNDLFYGLTSDPFLVRKHDIVYQFNLEEWAKVLLENWCGANKQPLSLADDSALIQPTMPLRDMNLPQHVLHAYVTRKRQFRDLVKNGGGEFIWGIQPFIYSKSALSGEEEHYISKLKDDGTVSEIYKRMPFLYEKLTTVIELPKDTEVADLHAHFRTLDASHTLFADFCHLVPAGDEKVAEFYADVIFNRIGSKLLSRM